MGKALLGIIIEWSDAEAKGMTTALLKRCKVHWIHLYQRVADKVFKILHLEKGQLKMKYFILWLLLSKKCKEKRKLSV